MQKTIYNLLKLGKALSHMARQLGEINTLIKHQHQRYTNQLKVTHNSQLSRLSKNHHSCCLLDALDFRTFDSKHNSQSSEEVSYGTQPDERVEQYGDYDWDECRFVTY